MSGGVKRPRCAIYTRKSTEEGLEQTFNTLDAQREACEAYVKSQAGEGWRARPQHYDDGGFSGGNLERPSMLRLLGDVDAGRIDVIVVYKVDRLTRSLMDFARIVERLDAQGVSFVSVTQAFNTTTSMGRLTLNVLLSFAQFEREVTGERIRDKIAASKARGMWMGGNVPLGYDLGDRQLVVNTVEAAQVRHIFERYLALKSGVSLMHELRRDVVMSKRWTSRAGIDRGGLPFSCGALYYLLQNRIYRGEIVHRGARHEGQHDAIVDHELFEQVQQTLGTNRYTRGARPTRAATCHLAGLIYDASGEGMKTTFSYGRKSRTYRYYVAASELAHQMIDIGPDTIRRIPAGPLEKLVREAIEKICARRDPLDWGDIRDMLIRVEIFEESVQLVIRTEPLCEPHEPMAILLDRLSRRAGSDRLVEEKGQQSQFRLVIDRRAKFRGGKIMEGTSLTECEIGDPRGLLKSAHRLLEAHSMSVLAAEHHVNATAPATQRHRHLMALGLISPKLQRELLDGSAIGKADILLRPDLPLAWADQLTLR